MLGTAPELCLEPFQDSNCASAQNSACCFVSRDTSPERLKRLLNAGDIVALHAGRELGG